MAERANGEPLSVQAALKTLQSLEGLEIGLYQRTEGVTWMVWGLVTAGIYFTFGTFASNLDPLPTWAEFLWVPWVAAGIAATIAVWRSARLSGNSQGRHGGLRFLLVYTAVYLGLFGLGFYVFEGLDRAWSLKEPGYVMVLLALASNVMGFLTTCSPAARRMLAVVGAAALLAGLLLAIGVTYSSTDHAYMVQSLVGVAVLGGGWFLGGLHLTVKG